MPRDRRLATIIGFSAVLMWSLLALLTAASGSVPPFQLTAMAFAIGGLLGLIWLAGRGGWRDLRQPAAAWVLGVGGLFGYHFFYFTALRNAPPIDASLIAYLWPLLIVVLSAFLPGERLRWFHLAGAALGLSRHRGGCDRRRGPLGRSRLPAGLCRRLRCGNRLVDLLGDVAPLCRRADRRRRRLLSRDRRLERRRPSPHRGDGLAGERRRMARRARPRCCCRSAPPSTSGTTA